MIPAATFTISATAQYVTPSPYGRQRPARIVERSTPATNSRASRDLPTPAAPYTVTRCTRLSRAGARERVVEQLELLLAPDERHRDDEPAADLLRHRDDPPGLDAGREPARRLRPERCRDDRVARQPLDGRAEEHLARLGRLLQARRRVDREPRRERGLGLVRDDLARLDADANLEPELADRVDDRERRPHRALGVVLVRDRNAERGHHRVAGELLDDAAVRRDAVRDLVEEAGQPRADDLGIGARDELRRADEVDEEHRRELPFHPRRIGTRPPPAGAG